MKVTTQIITPDWAKEPLIEIVADGGKPIYLGARKCAVIAQCAGQVAQFGSTWQPKAAKADKAPSRGSVKLVAGSLTSPVIAAITPEMLAMFQQFQAMQAASAAPVASAPAVPATNGKRNGKGAKEPAGTF